MGSLILHGRRFCELQKLCILRFAANPLQKASVFSSSFSSSSRDGQKGQNFTVSYLVGSLGLASKLAESISRKVCFEAKGSPDSVLNLLRSHGFRDSQISTIITDYPQLLIEDAEKSLGPKLQFLQSRGEAQATTSSELTEIVSKFPNILGVKKDKALSVYYDFAKEIIKADKSLEHKKLCHSSLPQGSPQENKIRNVLVLRELGVPQRLLFSLLISSRRIVCGKEKFEESLKKVVEMGFDPTSPKFVEALRVVYQSSDKAIQEKVNAYEKLGFDVGETWEMFKKWPQFLILSEKKIMNSMETFLGLGISRDEFTKMVKRLPSCIGFSEETVKKKTQFLVKKMNWPLKSVASHPQFIGYSMEKRIVPRCNVIKALMSKGLLGEGGSELPSVSRAFGITDEAFLNKYVRDHDDDKELVAELMAIFTRDHSFIGLCLSHFLVMGSLILHGRRFCELQKLCILRFAVNPFQNASAFSSSSSSSARDGKKGQNFTVSYLVDSLGLTTKLAQSISRRVSFEDKRSPDSVLSLLKSHGFTDSQICDIVTIYPQLLIADAEKSLGPKLLFLQSRGGATTFELTEIVSVFPKILGIKKDKAISRYYDFAKEIIEADKSSKFETLCPSLGEGSMQENKMRNILVLRDLGVPQRLLFSLLISDRQIVCGKERFEESLKKVVEMGFDPTSLKFVLALHAVYQLSDKAIQEKVNVYKKLGFTVDDVWAIFKKWPHFLILSEKNVLNSMEAFLGLGFTRGEFVMMVKCFPSCIGSSAETVKKKTEFLVKQMKWPLKAVASNPVVLGYSMEKRTVP
ncbi:unnamed protein product, partial [Microthlaspi erraticum]